jgi:hypothetical protein
MKSITFNEKEENLLLQNLNFDLKYINECIAEQEMIDSKTVSKRWKDKWQLPIVSSIMKLTEGVETFSERETFKMLGCINYYQNADFDTTELILKLGDQKLVANKKRIEGYVKYYSNYTSAR